MPLESLYGIIATGEITASFVVQTFDALAFQQTTHARNFLDCVFRVFDVSGSSGSRRCA